MDDHEKIKQWPFEGWDGNHIVYRHRDYRDMIMPSYEGRWERISDIRNLFNPELLLGNNVPGQAMYHADATDRYEVREDGLWARVYEIREG